MFIFVKNYGTLPFAGVARLAFIATKFLKSLYNENQINQEEIEYFTNNQGLFQI